MFRHARLIGYTAAILMTSTVSHALSDAPKDESNRILVEICDRAAASNLDPKRPSGMAGVASDKVDPSVAIPACEAAVRANANEPRLVFQLGRAYWAAKRFDDTRVQYEKADAASYGLATNNLAAMYAEGMGVTKDLAKYRSLMNKAADMGTPISQYNLGRNYVYGYYETEKDFVAGRKWLKQASEADFGSAMTDYAIMLRNGTGGPKDLVQARHWFLIAAQQGNAFAKFKYGAMLQDAEGGEKDLVEARRWYFAAANDGNKYAMNQIGYFNEMGFAGETNMTEARRWYLKGAEAGSEISMRNLALCLRHGRGGPRDLVAARQWFEKASLAGNPDATNDLGVMYVAGEGGPKDIAGGRQLYEKAISQGETKYARDNIAKIDAWYAATRRSAQRQRPQRDVGRRGGGSDGYRYSGGGNSYDPPPHRSTGLSNRGLPCHLPSEQFLGGC